MEPREEYEQIIAELSSQIDVSAEPSAALFLERGRTYFRAGIHDKALNDFLRVLELDPANSEACEYEKMLRDIFAFRYMDYYNP